ncbi:MULTISPECIES: choice-of-anchor Q domain-containing protein [Methylomonas]|uniref:DUF11 domain-containing protein n=2 Tax=Methylomonas TaxID=416 RepID=A0A126T6I8_9GAMM|nr:MULTISPECIES: choice-of-anchor Q domain-containing protein [Methylomonas]AMK77668.1 hypothetical protein JT25_014475 [Methylomonas denitrificans]OAH96839.1 hypothetical protein A1342_18095 [Methylomonas methanica]TCV86840.1 putative repeat protein (TIGR01451 family) [Methylomonas methanica]
MNSSKTSPSGNYMALAVLSALVGSPAWANTINVTNLLDVSAVADGSCTLREAVANANSDSDTTGGDCPAGTGADTITFGVNGTTVLSSTLTITDADGLTIDSLGRSVTLSGGNVVRVFWVTPGAALTLKSLTVANGYADPAGGGVYNQFGSLTVLNSTFVNNTATRTGGGIANYSDTNTANPNPAGNLTVVNSTFSGNSSVFGGAIKNFGFSATILNSTIVGNSVHLPVCPPGFICAMEDSGGGIDNAGTLNLHNSIVAGNTAAVGAADIGGSPTTASYNLIGLPADVYYRWNGLGPIVPLHGNNGNITGADANAIVASTLASNGGPTQTLALILGSAAIDAADNALCATVPVSSLDQRGVARPQGSQCDIGAFELAVPVSADLAVTTTASPAMVRDSLSWTIVVKNNGTANATGVKLTDILPVSGLSSISVTASQGSCGAPASGKITCNLGSLTNTASAIVTVKAVPTAAVTLSSQVSVLADQNDSQPLNNSAAQTVTVQPLLCNGLVPTIVGTPGADTLVGTKRRDIIHGLSGNDTISGGADNDIICGGLDQDLLKGDAGNDTLNGEAGTDSCDGGIGTDTATNCEVKIAVP